MITLPVSVLSRVWIRWNEVHPTGYTYYTDYARVSRRSSTALRFEEWLLKEGAIVQRINKKCYLQFTDEEEALVFRLRYS